jgi:methylamine dehydrogenase accessory protein MauD
MIFAQRAGESRSSVRPNGPRAPVMPRRREPDSRAVEVTLMILALLVGRTLLAAVLAAAGWSKLHDRDGARQAVADFGVPARLAAPLGLLLPLIELTVAALLLPARTAWWGAAGACMLLLVFAAAIAANLLSGRAPRCSCFGQMHSTPITWNMVPRNAVLAAFAGWMVWTGPAQALQFPPALPMIDLIVVLLLGAESVALGVLMRQHGRLLLRVDRLERASAKADMPPPQGLEVGAAAPDFELTALAGERVGLDRLLAESRDLVLIFSNPQCGPCADLMPIVAAWQKSPGGAARIAVITSGPESLNRTVAERHALTHVLLEEDGAVGRRYQVDGTPSAVLVRSDRTIGSRIAFGRDAIESLVVSSVGPDGRATAGVDKGHGMAA